MVSRWSFTVGPSVRYMGKMWQMGLDMNFRIAPIRKFEIEASLSAAYPIFTDGATWELPNAGSTNGEENFIREQQGLFTLSEVKFHYTLSNKRKATMRAYTRHSYQQTSVGKRWIATLGYHNINRIIPMTQSLGTTTIGSKTYEILPYGLATKSIRFGFDRSLLHYSIGRNDRSKYQNVKFFLHGLFAFSNEYSVGLFSTSSYGAATNPPEVSSTPFGILTGIDANLSKTEKGRTDLLLEVGLLPGPSQSIGSNFCVSVKLCWGFGNSLVNQFNNQFN